VRTRRPRGYGRPVAVRTAVSAGRGHAAGAEEKPATRAFTLVTSVVAPISLIVALLTYFGWTRTGAIYGYFGIDQTVLGLSVQDYLIRSAGVVFQPIAVVVIFALLALVVDQAVVWARGRTSPVLYRSTRWMLVLIGSGAVVVGLDGAVEGADLLVVDPLASACLLGIGATALAIVVKNSPPPGNSQLGGVILVFVCMLTSAFWATAVFASRTGNEVAEQVDRDPESRPALTVLSAEPLDLGGWPVTQSRVELAPDEFRYRYAGARLFAYANGRWVLIVGRGEAGRLRLLILRDSDAISVTLGS